MFHKAKWFMCGMLCAICMLGYLSWAQTATPKPAPKIVEAQEFRILDAKGKMRVSIGCSDEGIAHVSLINNQGLFTIAMQENGTVQFAGIDNTTKAVTTYQLQQTSLVPSIPAPIATPSLPRVVQSETVESQMDGEFNGWDGETIFKLSNGQIWQQSSYAYTYHYAYRPEVTIYPVSGGYKMRVEGVDSVISVKRLK